MDKANIQTRITQYIVDNFLYDESGFELTIDFPLFEQRVLDSMGIFRLLSFMNETFEIVIESDELTIENFGTIADMTNLVNNHLQNGAAPQSEFAAFTG